MSLILAAVLAVAEAGCGGQSDKNPVQPAPVITGLAILGNASFTAEVQTSQFVVTASYANGTNKDVSQESTWTTSAPAVVSVSATGLVTALAPGVAQITAGYQGRTATMQVTVTVALANCVYQLTSAKQVNFGASGGTGTATFTQSTGTNCTWTATAPVAIPWISVQNTAGSGNIVVRYTVGANSSSSQREGRIEVRWPGVQQGENIIISQTGTVTSPNAAPIVTVAFDGPDNCTPLPGKHCTVTVVAHADDSDGDAIVYAWSGCATGASARATCTIDRPGLVVAAVAVDDGHGHTVNGTASATGSNKAPGVQIGYITRFPTFIDVLGNVTDPDEGFLCGSQYCVSASASGSCKPAATLSCSCLGGLEVEVSPAAATGTCSLKITVKDSWGQPGTRTISFDVNTPQVP